MDQGAIVGCDCTPAYLVPLPAGEEIRYDAAVRLLGVGAAALALSGCGLILGIEGATLVVPEQPDASLGAAPGPVSNIVVVANAGGSFDITWDAPASAGGSPITEYSVESLPAGVSTTTTVLMYTTPALTVGTSYQFTVRAVNTAGPGQAAQSNSIFAGDVPAAPPQVTLATPDSGRLNASWTAADGHGYAITGYTVVASPGGKTVTVDGATTTAVVNGVTNMQNYTVTVTATNSFGTGAGGTSNASQAYCVTTTLGNIAALDSAQVNYGVGVIPATEDRQDIMAERNKVGGADTDIVGWAKFPLNTVDDWATITGLKVSLKVGLANEGVVSPVVGIWYSKDDGWTHGGGPNDLPHPTAAQVQATVAVSTTTTPAPGTMDQYTDFPLLPAARDWTIDQADGFMTLGLRNTATVAVGQLSRSTYYGADIGGSVPYLILTVCK